MSGPIEPEDIPDETEGVCDRWLFTDVLNAAIASGLVERPRRCGDCKHLGEPLTRYDWADLKDVPTRYRTCNRIEMAPDAYEIDSRTDLALAKDGSGYMASLLTLESFGCNLWEAKGEGE